MRITARMCIWACVCVHMSGHSSESVDMRVWAFVASTRVFARACVCILAYMCVGVCMRVHISVVLNA